VVLQISLLGKPEIKIEGTSIIDSFTQKGMALMCFLVTNREKSFSRDTISQMFWAESNDDAARYNLRYNLWLLRKSLKKAGVDEEFFISSQKGTIKFNTRIPYRLDVETFETGYRSKNIGVMKKSVKLYNGDFMEGVFLKDCFEFNDWLFVQKERYQAMYFDMLQELADYYTETGEYDYAIECLKRMLAINSLQEDVHRRLMITYNNAGDRAGAIKQYQRCHEILRSQLNISPSEETRTIYNNIRNQGENIKREKSLDPGREDRVIEINARGKVQYEFLSDMMREIIDRDAGLLNELPSYCIKELAVILPELEESFEIETRYIYPSDVFTNRLFFCCLKVLEKFARKTKLVIKCENAEGIDGISRLFIEYAKRHVDAEGLIFEI
jgi:DNA-binding SARP family transcriptional activator